MAGCVCCGSAHLIRTVAIGAPIHIQTSLSLSFGLILLRLRLRLRLGSGSGITLAGEAGELKVASCRWMDALATFRPRCSLGDRKRGWRPANRNRKIKYNNSVWKRTGSLHPTNMKINLIHSAPSLRTLNSGSSHRSPVDTPCARPAPV